MMNFKDISWQVTEPEYRASKNLSYSTLATFLREGLPGLKRVLDGEKKSSSSLLFGSLFDTMLTGAEDFDKLFLVGDFKQPTQAVLNIINELFDKYKQADDFEKIRLSSLSGFTKEEVIAACNKYDYYSRAKDDTRIGYISGAKDYYSMLVLSEDKSVVSKEDFQSAVDCIKAVKTCDFTKWIFDGTYELHYQLKFKLDGVFNIRCMFDIILVDYENKQIFPIDLKTSSHQEIEFYKSFYEWSYYIQSSMYSYILRESIKNTPFADFKVMPFMFLPINRYTKSPLLWIDSKSTQEDPSYFYLNGNKIPSWKELYENALYAIKNNEFHYTKEIIENKGFMELK